MKVISATRLKTKGSTSVKDEFEIQLDNGKKVKLYQFFSFTSMVVSNPVVETLLLRGPQDETDQSYSQIGHTCIVECQTVYSRKLTSETTTNSEALKEFVVQKAALDELIKMNSTK